MRMIGSGDFVIEKPRLRRPLAMPTQRIAKADRRGRGLSKSDRMIERELDEELDMKIRRE